MVIKTETVNIDVTLPDGGELPVDRSFVIFQLTENDVDVADNQVIPSKPIEVELDADGIAVAQLWPNDRGERGSLYRVSVVVKDERGIANKDKTYRYGLAQFEEGGGPYSLAAEVFDGITPDAVGTIKLKARVLLPDGTASLPALGFVEQPNTGVYRPSASVIGVSVNGTERARFTTSGMQLNGAMSGTAVTQTPVDDTAGRLIKVGDSASLLADYYRKNVSDLLADTDFTYTADQPGTVAAGDIIRTRAEGFSYEIAPSDAEPIADDPANGYHVTTAGGVKLYVLPGEGGAVSVRQCGAVGGAASSSADQTAFDTAFSTGYPVFIDPFIDVDPYYHLSNLNPPDGATLFGAGDSSKIKLLAGNYGNTSGSGSVGAIKPISRSGVHMSSFLVDGNAANVTGSNLFNIEGIDLVDCTDCIVDQVTVVNAQSDGVDLDDCVRCKVRNCRFEDCGGWGVHISTGSDSCETVGSTASNCGQTRQRGGFDVFSGAAENNRIVGCRTFGCYRGVIVQGENNFVIDHSSNSDEVYGVRVESGAAAHGCSVNGSLGMGFENFNGVTDGCEARNSAVHNFRLTGNDSTALNCTAGGAGDMNFFVDINRPASIISCRSLNPSEAAGKDFSGFQEMNTNYRRFANNFAADSKFSSRALSVGNNVLAKKVTSGAVSIFNILSGSDLEICSASGSNAFAAPTDRFYVCLSPSGGSGSPAADRIGLYRVIP